MITELIGDDRGHLANRPLRCVAGPADWSRTTPDAAVRAGTTT